MPVDLNDEAYTWDENGRLTKLNIAKCKLYGILSCEGLPALTYLNCGDNEITGLDVSKNTELEVLVLDHSQVSRHNY